MIEFISIQIGDYYSGYQTVFINPSHIVRIEEIYEPHSIASLIFDNGETVKTPYKMSQIMDILSGKTKADNYENCQYDPE